MDITGDRRMLFEMVYNLIDNAIRYNTDNGRVDVILERKMIRVKDTGIGIPEEHQSRIFERFYRVDKSHSKETGGTGLGLAIVKHIAENHEGRISLLSREGVGTEISILFPGTFPLKVLFLRRSSIPLLGAEFAPTWESDFWKSP